MRSTALAAFIAVAFGAVPAWAEVFEVRLQVTFDTFDGGPVFGESGPTPVDTTFLLDTDAAPVVVQPAGTGAWTFPLYGYDISAISDLSVTFGTKTWDTSHVLVRNAIVGFDAHVWFDAPVADGATPEIWLYLADGADSFSFGGASCIPCVLLDQARVSQDIVNDARGAPLDVTIRLMGACPAAPAPDCVAAERASLKLSEKKPGGEKMSAVLKKFDDPTGQSDLGDPVDGTTAYAVCLYDEAGALVLDLEVDRAGAACGTKACWKAKGTKGFGYKDSEAASDGVKKLSAKSGPIGKGKLQVSAGNKVSKGQTAFPTGATTALEGALGATLQVLISDALCYGAPLSSVKKADRTEFKAKTP